MAAAIDLVVVDKIAEEDILAAVGMGYMVAAIGLGAVAVAMAAHNLVVVAIVAAIPHLVDVAAYASPSMFTR